MSKRSPHAIAALGGILLSLLVMLPASAGDGDGPDVRIGWTAWSDAEVVSKMATLILATVGLDVELTLADVDAQYRGLAEGNLDLMLMSWQPNTHAGFLRRYDGDIEDLGVLYEGADLGLAVPAHVDESIRTIADLADHADRFDGAIQGIDAGAGIMNLTAEAMRTYGLEGFELREASGPVMGRNLGQAIEERRPIVVTAWRPHWKWAAYDLRYLEDPEGVYAGEEAVHAMARRGFAEDQPRVAAFIERMHFDLPELQALMNEARDQGHRQAIRAWLNRHDGRVREWLQGN